MTFSSKFETKQEYRKGAKELRNSLDMQAISNAIAKNLKNQDFFKFSQNILGFYPFNNEVDLRELFKDNSKNWYLPRVEAEVKGLLINKYKVGDILVKNKWGIPEPCCDLEDIDPSSIDIVLIPALMVDKHGHRLGYGAGFYDRFLSSLRKDCLKIVPIPQELTTESLPFDHWDIPVNIALTQNNVTYF